LKSNKTKSKTKSKSYTYSNKPEPKHTFETTSKKLEKAGKFFKSEIIKPKQEEVKVEKCPCCVAQCKCCYHLSGTAITDHTCKCRCHYKEGHNY